MEKRLGSNEPPGFKPTVTDFDSSLWFFSHILAGVARAPTPTHGCPGSRAQLVLYDAIAKHAGAAARVGENLEILSVLHLARVVVEIYGRRS